MMTRKKKKAILRVLLYIVLILYAVITIFPFLWAISASFKPYAEITNGDLNLIPKNFSISAYKYLFTMDKYFPRWILNSIIIAVVGTVLNIFINTMAGYSLARLSFPGKNRIFFLVIAVITVPGQVLLIPNYLIISNLGLLNTYSAVILPMAVNATYIVMMRQFFINFPTSVEEAAKIDGLGRFGVFFRIAMPLAKPAIATQATFIFLGFWNNFLGAKLYLKDPSKYTLTVGIQASMSQYGGITQWDRVMAASVISLVPILIIYIILNKYFMQSVRMDGEK